MLGRRLTTIYSTLSLCLGMNLTYVVLLYCLFFLHKTSFKIVLGDIAREKAAVEKELSKGVRFSSLVL